ncbi:TPA: YbaN family protein [Staphylococcus aureus]|uniref:YbaN family protein n=1 Tax=Staphylococcus aureus TaxID=1280 RepID=UPI0014552AAC|nr:YbaN family protein [Staphylococcus aureus]HDJ5520268.1 YbaN family protein [Staphylococcus aureus]HDJ5776767.1 YbaN family protein [Staphylococcus aureus]HDJ5779492.1 YbaN family protein [Staphylococcus aureus]HDJ5794247.1 YbaN family protein [Staphylococcus aureus]
MRLILIVIGLIFTALGIAGAVLPLLPTTPFLLVAVFCFSRSSDRFYNWLINQKIYKEYVENFYLHRGYTLQQKIKILISLYIVIAFSIYMVDVLAVRVGLIIMVIIQTAVLFTFVKTLPKSNHKIEE